MTIKLENPSAHRFSALLGPTASHTPLHDRPLFTSPKWVVAPSLGSILPGWLLVIPREEALNFRQWAISGGNPASTICEITETLGVSTDEIVWFEHGPSMAGTQVGCGLDYAHIHVLIRPPFSLSELLAQTQSLAALEWSHSPAGEVYQRLAPRLSYFVAGQGAGAAYVHDVDHAGSQFFRRAIAALTGQPELWNYRWHGHDGNIAQTVQVVGELLRRSPLRA